MVYPEVERRRQMLRALHARVEGSEGLGLIVVEREVVAMGEAIGLDRHQAIRLFIRLLEEGYVRVTPQQGGRLYFGVDQRPFTRAVVENLTADGLRLIGVLLSENPCEALLVGLEHYVEQLERDPDIPEEQQQGRWWRTVLGTLRNVGTDFGAKVTGEVITRRMRL